jgi:hypothetical protein
MTEIASEKHLVDHARVSTYGQTLDAQLAQLRAEGCAKIYQEKASGARADRRAPDKSACGTADYGPAIMVGLAAMKLHAGGKFETSRRCGTASSLTASITATAAVPSPVAIYARPLQRLR